ncbi:hypothetical protein [Cerasicoccus frondis]|uniref:hypothetical protein n=1 Tax=Cerasicoccus frondis TaxID=490090 RepID=UPI002852C9CE|nr:hypothetical protein [Cerasicoccus frondis]
MLGRKETFREFSLYELLSESKPEHHEGIRDLWGNTAVHYLVVFGKKKIGEKAILSVGPSLDYETLDDVMDLVLDGLRPIGYVKCLVLEQIAREGVAAETARHMEKIHREQREAEEHERTRAMEARDLDEAWKIIREREKELDNREVELRTRESYIEESENKLSEIAQSHYEAENELAQREESLRKWQLRLEAREALLSAKS